MRRPFKVVAPLLVTAGMVLAAAPAGAAPKGVIEVDSSGLVTSTKDISNIVIKDCDGNVTKTEFNDGTHEYELGDSVAMVWVKAGNNKSGHGPGYGELLNFSNCGTGVVAT